MLGQSETAVKYHQNINHSLEIIQLTYNYILSPGNVKNNLLLATKLNKFILGT